ncbi:MAG TPA: NCS2 family permease [Pyrinomonadaceae bacterium]|nr:NCS2 family permease [Pyrinomonadaceae bacterium]
MDSPAAQKSNLKTEAIAGITTFFTMAYIVIVNPQILSAGGKTGMAFSGVLTATVLICFTMTLLMGLYAKLPFAVAPGMGINAFFTFTIILGKGVPWQTALGIIFWAGVFFLLISVTPIRESIAKAIPTEIRIAAAAGIGIFLTFIGLKNAGFIVADPITFVKLGSLGKPALLTILGLAISVFLMSRKNPFAFLAAIVIVTILSWALGLVSAPSQALSLPDFKSVFFKLDVLGALKLSLLPSIISILFTDLFDSISTFIGVAHAGDLLDEHGHPRNLRQGLIVDSLATMGAGLAGSSSGTAYIESVAGIRMGGRTGLTSVFTALCFLPCFFIAPLAGMVPPFASAAVLILVGAAMFTSIGQIRFSKLEEGVPAFLTLILIPLTFSITQGILGLHLARRTLFDGRPPPRDSSRDVCAGARVDRIAGARAGEVFVMQIGDASVLQSA